MQLLVQQVINMGQKHVPSMIDLAMWASCQHSVQRRLLNQKYALRNSLRFSFSHLVLCSAFNFIPKGANFCLFRSTSPNLRNEVLIMVTMKVTGFWVVTSCSLIEVYQHFRGTLLRNVGRLLPGNTASHCRSLFNLPSFYILHVSDTRGNFQQHTTPYNESRLHIKKLIILFKLL